jgi:hypothetical protein
MSYFIVDIPDSGLEMSEFARDTHGSQGPDVPLYHGQSRLEGCECPNSPWTFIRVKVPMGMPLYPRCQVYNFLCLFVCLVGIECGGVRGLVSRCIEIGVWFCRCVDFPEYSSRSPKVS